MKKSVFVIGLIILSGASSAYAIVPPEPPKDNPVCQMAGVKTTLSNKKLLHCLEQNDCQIQGASLKCSKRILKECCVEKKLIFMEDMEFAALRQPSKEVIDYLIYLQREGGGFAKNSSQLTQFSQINNNDIEQALKYIDSAARLYIDGKKSVLDDVGENMEWLVQSRAQKLEDLRLELRQREDGKLVADPKHPEITQMPKKNEPERMSLFTRSYSLTEVQELIDRIVQNSTIGVVEGHKTAIRLKAEWQSHEWSLSKLIKKNMPQEEKAQKIADLKNEIEAVIEKLKQIDSVILKEAGSMILIDYERRIEEIKQEMSGGVSQEITLRLKNDLVILQIQKSSWEKFIARCEEILKEKEVSEIPKMEEDPVRDPKEEVAIPEEKEVIEEKKKEVAAINTGGAEVPTISQIEKARALATTVGNSIQGEVFSIWESAERYMNSLRGIGPGAGVVAISNSGMFLHESQQSQNTQAVGGGGGLGGLLKSFFTKQPTLGPDGGCPLCEGAGGLAQQNNNEVGFVSKLGNKIGSFFQGAANGTNLDLSFSGNPEVLTDTDGALWVPGDPLSGQSAAQLGVKKGETLEYGDPRLRAFGYPDVGVTNVGSDPSGKRIAPLAAPVGGANFQGVVGGTFIREIEGADGGITRIEMPRYEFTGNTTTLNDPQEIGVVMRALTDLRFEDGTRNHLGLRNEGGVLTGSGFYLTDPQSGREVKFLAGAGHFTGAIGYGGVTEEGKVFGVRFDNEVLMAVEGKTVKSVFEPTREDMPITAEATALGVSAGDVGFLDEESFTDTTTLRYTKLIAAGAQGAKGAAVPVGQVTASGAIQAPAPVPEGQTAQVQTLASQFEEGLIDQETLENAVYVNLLTQADLAVNPSTNVKGTLGGLGAMLEGVDSSIIDAAKAEVVQKYEKRVESAKDAFDAKWDQLGGGPTTDVRIGQIAPWKADIAFKQNQLDSIKNGTPMPDRGPDFIVRNGQKIEIDSNFKEIGVATESDFVTNTVGSDKGMLPPQPNQDIVVSDTAFNSRSAGGGTDGGVNDIPTDTGLTFDSSFNFPVDGEVETPVIDGEDQLPVDGEERPEESNGVGGRDGRIQDLDVPVQPSTEEISDAVVAFKASLGLDTGASSLEAINKFIAGVNIANLGIITQGGGIDQLDLGSVDFDTLGGGGINNGTNFNFTGLSGGVNNLIAKTEVPTINTNTTNFAFDAGNGQTVGGDRVSIGAVGNTFDFGEVGNFDFGGGADAPTLELGNGLLQELGLGGFDGGLDVPSTGSTTLGVAQSSQARVNLYGDTNTANGVLTTPDSLRVGVALLADRSEVTNAILARSEDHLDSWADPGRVALRTSNYLDSIQQKWQEGAGVPMVLKTVGDLAKPAVKFSTLIAGDALVTVSGGKDETFDLAVNDISDSDKNQVFALTLEAKQALANGDKVEDPNLLYLAQKDMTTGNTAQYEWKNGVYKLRTKEEYKAFVEDNFTGDLKIGSDKFYERRGVANEKELAVKNGESIRAGLEENDQIFIKAQQIKNADGDFVATRAPAREIDVVGNDLVADILDEQNNPNGGLGTFAGGAKKADTIVSGMFDRSVRIGSDSVYEKLDGAVNVLLDFFSFEKPVQDNRTFETVSIPANTTRTSPNVTQRSTAQILIQDMDSGGIDFATNLGKTNVVDSTASVGDSFKQDTTFDGTTSTANKEINQIENDLGFGSGDDFDTGLNFGASLDFSEITSPATRKTINSNPLYSNLQQGGGSESQEGIEIDLGLGGVGPEPNLEFESFMKSQEGLELTFDELSVPSIDVPTGTNLNIDTSSIGNLSAGINNLNIGNFDIGGITSVGGIGDSFNIGNLGGGFEISGLDGISGASGAIGGIDTGFNFNGMKSFDFMGAGSATSQLGSISTNYIAPTDSVMEGVGFDSNIGSIDSIMQGSTVGSINSIMNGQGIGAAGLSGIGDIGGKMNTFSIPQFSFP